MVLSVQWMERELITVPDWIEAQWKLYILYSKL